MHDEVWAEIMRTIELQEAEWLIDNNKVIDEITKLIHKLNFLIWLEAIRQSRAIKHKSASLSAAIKNIKLELNGWMQQLTPYQ